MTTLLRRSILLRVSTVRSVFRTFARLRMMHSKQVMTAMYSATMSLTSMSQSIQPGHHPLRLSVGQMRELTRFIRLLSMIQNTRLAAATFRFRTCHTSGVKLRMIVKSASRGNAMALGETRLSVISAMFELYDIFLGKVSARL